MYALDADEFPIILLTISRGMDILRLSSDATQVVYSQQIGAGVAQVVDSSGNVIISSPGGEHIIAYAQKVYGTISRGQAFIFFPFELTLPQDQAESVPKMKVTVENVSAEIGWWLRKSTEKPAVTVEVVSSGDPDTPVASFPDFELSAFRGGSMTVEADLTLSNLEREPFPAGTFNPTHFPGLF
jgi:hypothetical protein